MDSEQVDTMLNNLGWMYNIAENKYIKYNLSRAYCSVDQVCFKLVPIFKKKPHANDLCKKIWEIIKTTAEEKKPDCSHCDNKRTIKILNIRRLPFLNGQYKRKIYETNLADEALKIKCPFCSGAGDIRRYNEELSDLSTEDQQLADRYFKFWNPTINPQQFEEPF